MKLKIKSIIPSLFLLLVGTYLIRIAPTTKYPVISYVLGGFNLFIGFSALVIPFTVHLLKKTNHEN